MAKYKLEDLYEYYDVDILQPVLEPVHKDYTIFEIELSDSEHIECMSVYEEWKAWNDRLLAVRTEEQRKYDETNRAYYDALQEDRDRKKLKELIATYGIPK
jgi:hypothetical protein